ncbi:hypothetical protein DPMN_164592 [Dreissena polymorpha]|uniref:Uncharacterized protein n=1 Tax=Dreissena polymorpha TaxID=45954 RepID=A0A9D4ITV0_DREPO|nr:hypothetical protein DPMN_164592 [Dreissena polymorpha]
MSHNRNDISSDMNEFLAKIACPSDDLSARASCIPRQKTMTCQKIKMEGKEFTIEDICQILRNNVGIILDPRPRNKHQNMLHKRISSLERWNGRTKKTISNMDIAHAGFYYEKSIDCLRCFHCLVIFHRVVRGQIFGRSTLKYFHFVGMCGNARVTLSLRVS